MRKLQPYILFFLTTVLYVTLGYFTERHQTLMLMGEFSGLFLLYLVILLRGKEEFKFWIGCAIALRVLLLFAVPNLSDDFYRFVWDGRLWNAGIHPFAHVPRYYIEATHLVPGIDPNLFASLNSKDYFTVYPPLTQFVFWLSVRLSPHSVYGSLLVMKLLVVMAEMGSIVLMNKISQQLKIAKTTVLVYALNPLVLIELTGNLHFEAFLIFFLLLSVYLLANEKWVAAALAFSASICFKLLPLIFLPALLPYLGWRKAFRFYAVTGLCVLIFFVPLYHASLVENFGESLGYYFKKFEFNASVYYLVRELGFWIYGYNIIQTVGWKLGMISALLILFISFSLPRQLAPKIRPVGIGYSIFTIWLFVIFIYLLFGTTVHPWYAIPVLAISIFTNYRFALLWTGLIFLTYTGYSTEGYQENYWVVAVEYTLVLGYFLVEWTTTNSPFSNSRTRSE
jgi:alpha-1,6-mannosyltransferase